MAGEGKGVQVEGHAVLGAGGVCKGRKGQKETGEELSQREGLGEAGREEAVGESPFEAHRLACHRIPSAEMAARACTCVPY